MSSALLRRELLQFTSCCSKTMQGAPRQTSPVAGSDLEAAVMSRGIEVARSCDRTISVAPSSAEVASNGSGKRSLTTRTFRQPSVSLSASRLRKLVGASCFCAKGHRRKRSCISRRRPTFEFKGVWRAWERQAGGERGAGFEPSPRPKNPKLHQVGEPGSWLAFERINPWPLRRSELLSHLADAPALTVSVPLGSCRSHYRDVSVELAF